MRTPVIAGNWKLYKTAGQALELVGGLLPLVAQTKGVEIVVAPVFTVLGKVAEALAGSNIHLSAQDCFWEEEGAFTGEISSTMLIDAGCSHVIIGHSERRQFFGETDATVNKKIKAAIKAGLTVLFCIGETLQEREGDQTFDVLRRQVTQGLRDLSQEQLKKVIIAYEPVWAIGTGKTATDSQAQEAHQFIRGVIAGLYDKDAAEEMRILYGGSVKPENIGGLMAQADIDGALVGGASLKADSFAAIAKLGK
ncbi:triosephosphate isomerase [Geotalea daltonii FRC-32]|uniref:Triosephosphate isomerase n=1 Tax=Geotalea daltonii (strain DSM 22248 / JCM 15807 / FRC-32) TaxID=316067 RepID=B9M2C4_GEODF|nr:triose-phosphate isomerase [Geotalea daltonii]ACM21242.1 triosephosphate isomerase [Geotalea daltonii FRC-32]